MSQSELIIWVRSLNFKFGQAIIDGINRESEESGIAITGKIFWKADADDLSDILGINSNQADALWEKIQDKKDTDFDVPEETTGLTFDLKIVTKKLHTIKGASSSWTIMDVKRKFLLMVGDGSRAILYRQDSYNWNKAQREGIQIKYCGRSQADNKTLKDLGIINGLHTPLITTWRIMGGPDPKYRVFNWSEHVIPERDGKFNMKKINLCYQQDMVEAPTVNHANDKRVIDELTQQFKGAYFTANNDDAKKDECKDNDDLSAGIGTVVSAKDNAKFTQILEKFQENITNKLDQHKSLENKIKNNKNNKYVIKQELGSLVQVRKAKIKEQYAKRIKEIEEHNKEMNKLWEKQKQEILVKNNNSSIIKRQIEKERQRRMRFQQRQIAIYEQQREKEEIFVDEMQLKQESHLSQAKDLHRWHLEFKKEEIKQEKKKTLTTMIKQKIETTRQQTKFAKYLQSSPLGEDLRQKAKDLDHEITKIAELSDEPLLIDMVDRKIANDEQGDDEKVQQPPEESEYLELELRFNDDYKNCDEKKIKQNLAATSGVDMNDLILVSSREGCIISKFKIKMKKVYEKAKKSAAQVNESIKTGFKQFTDKAYDTTISSKWAQRVDGCVTFLERKLGKAKTNKNALYLASKCVAVIISQFAEDKNKKILDDDFLNDEVSKESHKVIMDPKWNKEYGPGKVHWKGANTDGLDRGGYPYFCPNGWKRYGIRIDDFDKKYKGWAVCYHGTQSQYAGSILSHGIFGTQDTTQRFFSPSIVYSAHPRYGTPQKLKNGKYIQTVFQCRIDPKVMLKKGTTTGGYGTIIDPNFDKEKQNKEIEWYLDGVGIDKYVVYGIMVRISDDPAALPDSHWWGKDEGQWYINWREDI